LPPDDQITRQTAAQPAVRWPKRSRLLASTSSIHPADFTGREAELDKLCAAVEIGGVIISGLYGMGGIGNTTVAPAGRNAESRTIPTPRSISTCAGPARAHSSRSMLWRTSSPLSSRKPGSPSDEGTLEAQYRSVLQSKRVLLLMDNAHGADQVKDLLPPTGSILLITSRRHFALPGLLYLKLEQMSPSEAVDLALKIAPRLGESSSVLAELCDYLPLALRISASTFRETEDLSESLINRCAT
jgi:hypothetical protein